MFWLLEIQTSENIKLTFEKQNGGKLAFLDVLISNENDNFFTSVFCKKTSIGLYTIFREQIGINTSSFSFTIVKPELDVLPFALFSRVVV